LNKFEKLNFENHGVLSSQHTLNNDKKYCPKPYS